MATIKVPAYERQIEGPNQNASRARAPEPLRQAYGENVAQATGSFGKAMQQLGQDMIQINAQINKDNLSLQTAKMNDAFKVFYAEMKQRDDFYNFDADTDKAIDTQLSQLKARLGNDRLFDKWYAVEGKAYVESLKTQTQLMKLPAQYKYNKNNLEQLGQQLSYDYATGSDGAKIEFYQTIENNKVLSQQDKEDALYKFERSYAINEIESMINDYPQQVIDNINSNKYIYDIGGEKGDDLSPKEKAMYLKRAENIRDAKDKTVLSETMEDVMDWWGSMPMFEKNQTYKKIVAEKEKTGRSMLDDMFPNLKGKKQERFINYMGSVVNDNANGFNSMGEYIVQQNQQLYDQTFNNRGEFKKDVPFTQAIAIYSQLSATLKNEDMNLSPEKTEKLNKLRNLVLFNLGNNVLSNTIESPSGFQTSGGRKTNNFEFARDTLREVLERDGFVNYFGAIENNSMTTEDIGTIFTDVFLSIENKGIDPTARDSKREVMNVIATEIRDYYAQKLGWSREQANAFLINKKVINYSDTANKDSADLILEGY